MRCTASSATGRPRTRSPGSVLRAAHALAEGQPGPTGRTRGSMRVALGAEAEVAEAPRHVRSGDGIGDHGPPCRVGGPRPSARTPPCWAAAAAHRTTRPVHWPAPPAVVALVAGVVLMPDPEPPRLSRHLGEPVATCRRPAAVGDQRVGAPPGARCREPALDGRWRTAPLTRADVAGALRVAGLGGVRRLRRDLPERTGSGSSSPCQAERSVLTVAGDQRCVAHPPGGRGTGSPSSRCRPTSGFTHFRWSRRRPSGQLVFTGPELAKHSGSRPRCTRSRCTPPRRSRAH